MTWKSHRPSSRCCCVIRKTVSCCTDPTGTVKRRTTSIWPNRRLSWARSSVPVGSIKSPDPTLRLFFFFITVSLCAGRLNTNEDNENMLGYDLYSSALADMLSEPSLSMPITVGLYAKWGSGKSFLLSKLRGKTLRRATK